MDVDDGARPTLPWSAIREPGIDERISKRRIENTHGDDHFGPVAMSLQSGSSGAS
jgi:hypothetical protein